jgi:hypothetical protein
VASRFITAAFAIGVVALTIAFVIPPMLEAPNEDTASTVQLDEGDVENLNTNLDITLIATDKQAGTANVQTTDLTTGETLNETIAVDETATFQMPDGEVTVTVESLTGTKSATLTASYPATYGFSEGGVAIAENIGILLVAIALLLISGILVTVVNI